MPKSQPLFLADDDGGQYLNPLGEHRPTARALRMMLEYLLERHEPGDLLLLRRMYPRYQLYLPSEEELRHELMAKREQVVQERKL